MRKGNELKTRVSPSGARGEMRFETSRLSAAYSPGAGSPAAPYIAAIPPWKKPGDHRLLKGKCFDRPRTPESSQRKFRPRNTIAVRTFANYNLGLRSQKRTPIHTQK